MKKSLARRTGAFTLIEVLVVITIIGMLAALGFAGYRMAQIKAYTNQTETRIKALEARLERYHSDNGEYPGVANEEDATEIKGTQYQIGAAKMLYQVMSGDGNDQIRGAGDNPSTGEQGSSDRVLWDEVVAPTAQEVRERKRKPLVESAGDQAFYIIDGFRKPFQYQKAIKDRNRKITNEDELHSGADFEIWSYGTAETTDDDLTSQRDWIKSWDIR